MSARVGSAIAETLTDDSLEDVRRASPVDAMLFGTVLLWALNITVTKYMFEHGWSPLAYGTIRYFVAISLFWSFTYWRGSSFWVESKDPRAAVLPGGPVFLQPGRFRFRGQLPPPP